jgi:uncharacterized protein (UPF0276 family)
VLDSGYEREVGAFLARHGIEVYSDHLTFYGDAGLLCELLPMPFTAESVRHMAAWNRQI